jgi:CarD family transcriptional regulator
MTVKRGSLATAVFAVQDRVVYPGHGVAKINRVVEKEVGTLKVHFYELKFLSKDMTVLVPMTNLASVGIRKLSSRDYIDSIFSLLAQPNHYVSTQELMASNWNKRNKEYQAKIRKGDLLELTEIYRELRYIAVHKELSFGEKNLLTQTEMLLAEEISLVEQHDTDRALQQLRTTCNTASVRLTL